MIAFIGVPVARCTVARLMRDMGLAGVIRGKPVRPTVSGKAAPCPLNRAGRQFRAGAEHAPGAGFHVCRDLGVSRSESA